MVSMQRLRRLQRAYYRAALGTGRLWRRAASRRQQCRPNRPYIIRRACSRPLSSDEFIFELRLLTSDRNTPPCVSGLLQQPVARYSGRFVVQLSDFSPTFFTIIGFSSSLRCPMGLCSSAKYYDQRVRLSVCLFVRWYILKTTHSNLPNFLCMLPVDVARLSLKQ